MPEKILGIHHITAIATSAKKNHAFYTEVLGLRLVKKTVNFDDPTTYHFYYGNKRGEPVTGDLVPQRSFRCLGKRTTCPRLRVLCVAYVERRQFPAKTLATRTITSDGRSLPHFLLA